MLYALFVVVIVCFLVILGTVIWLWYKNPHGLIAWWNQVIESECVRQNCALLPVLEPDGGEENPYDHIPAFKSARSGINPVATKLNNLIHMNHDNILIEVMSTLQSNPPSPHIAYPPWMKNESKWNPLWIKFMGTWTPIADQIPTLKRITSFFPEIVVMHISVFYPGSTLIEHQGPSRTVHRYHYGLKIPPNDVGLKIEGKDIAWEEKEGFVWDDTLPHSAWNHTNEPRIVIFADILRPLSHINSWGSQLIHTLTQYNPHTMTIKSQLQTV